MVLLSDYFEVTTDYLLKGIKPAEIRGENGGALASKVLYIASTAFVAIGLLCAFGGWYEKQTADAVWGSMIIQAVGVAGYFIGKLLSPEKPPFAVQWLNLTGILWMPVSMLSGVLSLLFFRQGWVAPYPNALGQTCIFAALYAGTAAAGFFLLKKQKK